MNDRTHATPSSAHAVQFYEHDEFLVDVAARFLGDGLRAGEGVVVVATRAHLDAMAARLEGLDLPRALESGRAKLLDANETLSDIMLLGAPQRARFEQRVGGALDACVRSLVRTGNPPRVRAFGEMVHLLFADGHPQAAFRLEELWEEAARAHELSLLCAYGMKNFRDGDDTDAFLQVCARHGRVMPPEVVAYGKGDGDDDACRARALGVLQRSASAPSNEVDQRKELERALEHAVSEQRRAEHASRMRDELLAAVTQELRTPLKAIVGWSSLLRGAPAMSPADVREAADAIERHARAQTALLEDVSDASRIVGGTLAIRPRAVDLAFLVRESVDAVTTARYAKRLAVSVCIEADPCLAQADPHRIRQVFSNVLSNAVQFTPDGGRIDVRLGRSDGSIEFVVQDTGCGIEAHALPLVFEGLRRVDGAARATRRAGEGLRLGLAMTRHLVELHGGSIEATSPGRGRGSIFTVRLPRHAPGGDA